MTKSQRETRQKEVFISSNCGYSFPVLAKRYKVSECGIRKIWRNGWKKFAEFQKF